MSAAKEKAERSNRFLIQGQVTVEKCDTPPGDLKLKAYVFTGRGQFLAAENVDEKGTFQLALDLKAPIAVELFVGPDDDPKAIRQTTAYSEWFAAEAWVQPSSLSFDSGDHRTVFCFCFNNIFSCATLYDFFGFLL